MTRRTESRNWIGSKVHELWVFEVGRRPEWAPTGPMGTSAVRWGTQLEPVDDRRTRVSDLEMAATKAAVKPSTRGCVEL